MRSSKQIRRSTSILTGLIDRKTISREQDVNSIVCKRFHERSVRHSIKHEMSCELIIAEQRRERVLVKVINPNEIKPDSKQLHWIELKTGSPANTQRGKTIQFRVYVNKHSCQRPPIRFHWFHRLRKFSLSLEKEKLSTHTPGCVLNLIFICIRLFDGSDLSRYFKSFDVGCGVTDSFTFNVYGIALCLLRASVFTNSHSDNSSGKKRTEQQLRNVMFLFPLFPKSELRKNTAKRGKKET